MNSDVVAWLALIVAIVSAGVTIWRYRRDIRRQESYDYLTASSRLLEQAFEAFDQARDTHWKGLPRPDRLLWLTVARMLKESDDTASRITELSHKTLYGHSRHLWRGKFVDLLRPLDDIPLTYFAETADSIVSTRQNERMCIAPKSLRVVLDFLEWAAGRSDPIAETADFEDHEIDQIRTLRYRILGDYLDATDAMLREGEVDRKDFWRAEWRKVRTEAPP